MASKKIKNGNPPSNSETIKIAVKEPKVLTPINSPVFRLPSAYSSLPTLNRRSNLFEPCEYDLYEISRIEDVESYVRQAFKKKIGLFLKEGYAYVSTDPRITKYLNIRFKQIAQVSGVPHEEMMRKVVSSFVKKSNAFLIKVRDVDASGGKIRLSYSGKEVKPVAAYFIAPAETMEVETDGSGKPTKWRQKLPNGMMKEFMPENVVHFTFDRKDGFLFGTPILSPVIDDIKALRKIEENIELLIYKHLFPLFQYQVGTDESPATINQDGEKEISVVQRELEFLPSEGAIVTSERHKITAIGAENSALRAEKYLEYFQRRVFAGLGVSSVDFGLAETVNRSTSDNLSRALIDDVKDMQESFEAQFNELVIKELLLESTLNLNTFLDEQSAKLSFKEIDLDKQVKMENHYVDLFTKNGITFDEMRMSIGRDMIEIPEDGNDQDPTSYPQWFRTYWKLFDEPAKLIGASDEPYSHIAQAVAQSAASGVTSENVASSQAASEKLAKTTAAAKKVPKKDNIVKTIYEEMYDCFISELVSSGGYKKIENTTFFQTLKEKLVDTIAAQVTSSFLHGFGQASKDDLAYLSSKRRDIRNRVHSYITKFLKELSSTIDKRYNLDVLFDSKTGNVTISSIRIVFDTLSYRINWISDTEKKKAFNLGKIAKLNAGTEVNIQNDSCIDCQKHKSMIFTKTISDFENVPPFHPGCECELKV